MFTFLSFVNADISPMDIPQGIWLRLVDSGLSFMLFGAAIYYFVKKESRTEILISNVIQHNTDAINKLETLVRDLLVELRSGRNIHDK